MKTTLWQIDLGGQKALLMTVYIVTLIQYSNHTTDCIIFTNQKP